MAVLRCPSCGQANRVPDLASGQKAICGKCKTPLAGADGGRPVTLTDANFRELIGSGATIVDFWAPWCGPCRAIGPLIEELAAERPEIRFGKLNVDHNPTTAANFDARSIPLLVFFRDGVERGRLLGARPKGQIEAAIRQYLT